MFSATKLVLLFNGVFLMVNIYLLWRARQQSAGSPWGQGEAQLRSMISNAPEAILIFDADRGRFALANERAADLFGLTVEELLTLGPAQLSPPMQPDGRCSVTAIADYVQAAMAGATPAFEWCHQNALGASISCEVRLIRVESSRRRLIRGSVVDISDRLWAENALRRSEERFRAVIDAQEEFVVRWLPDGTCTFVNPAYCRDCGKAEEALLGTNLLEDSMLRAEVLEQIKDLSVQRPTVRSHYRSERDHGAMRWHEWNHCGLFDGEGRLIEIQSVGRDITERKLAEAEAHKSRSLLVAAVEQIPAGILIADAPDVNIRIANSAATGIRGASADDLTQVPFELHPERWQVYHPDGRPFAADELPLSRAVLYGETTNDCDAIVRRPDGEERWVMANAAPVRNADGEVVAGVVVFADVTRRRRLEMAVRSVVETTSALTGASFFNRMVAELSGTLDADVAFVGELTNDGKSIRVLVSCNDGVVESEQEVYPLVHTSCAEVVGKQVQIFTDRAAELFPHDTRLQRLGIQGYAGAPLFDRQRRAMGIIGVLSRSPITDPQLSRNVLEIFAIRAGAEMDRLRADEALRQSEERFRKTFDEAPIGAAIIDQHGCIRRVNENLQANIGYGQDQLLQKRFGEFLHPDDVARLLDGKRKLVNGEIECDSGERRMRRRDGTTLWVNTSVRIISDPTGEPLFLAMLEDISARKKAEQALQERLELEQFVVGLSSTFVGAPAHHVDREINRALRRIGEFFDVDRIALREFRSGRAAVLTHGWVREENLSPESDVAMDQVPHASKVLDGEVIQFSDEGASAPDRADEVDLLNRMGVKAYLAIPLRVGDSLVGAFTLGSDRASRRWPSHLIQWLRVVGEMFAGVLVRRRAEQKLFASREKLRALAAELTRVEAQERHQIATYLHDQIGQALAVLRMKFGVLTSDPSPQVFDRTIVQIRQLLHETIQDMQSLTFDLSPPVLHELGLRAAIEWVAERMTNEHGLHIRIDEQDFDERLDADIATLLFRAVRELLVNVVKHADAEQTHIRLRRTDEELIIAVEDDGLGFDTEVLEPRAETTHFGLFSIRERLQYVGGRMEVRSTPGAGTHIVLIAPNESSTVAAQGAAL